MITLRPPTYADSELAYQIKKAAFFDYADQAWGWDEAEQRDLHKNRFNPATFQIIQSNGIDVGVLVMVQEQFLIQVSQLFILPDYQDKGIGKHCMMQVIAKANASSLPIRLRVLKVNPRAIAFYERLGFCEIGEIEKHSLFEKSPEIPEIMSDKGLR